jgi:death-on-curing protein
LRDAGRLDAAVAAAAATFDGEFLHADPYRLAAAYAVYIIRGHPFLDGNKRIGLSAALTFLDLNSIPANPEKESIYEACMGVARGQSGVEELAFLLRP